MKRSLDNLGRVVIPKEMRKVIGVENGEELNIELEDNKIIITKPNEIDYKAIVEKAIEYIEKEFDEYSEFVFGIELKNKTLEILKERKTN